MELEYHGRILVPPLLREYARLGQMGNAGRTREKIELWGESQWELVREDWLSEELPREEKLLPELRTISL